MKSRDISSFFDIDKNLLNLFKETPWETLRQLKSYFSSYPFSMNSPIPSNVAIKNKENIFIGKNVKIDPFVYIEGPCIILDGAHLSHASYVRPYTVIGSGARVGHASEVKHSIIMPGASLAHFNYVGDSIIGKGVNLGAGVKCANVRHDKGGIVVSFEGQKIDTGLVKMGAIIGDGCKIGCNVVLNPGTVLVKNVQCFVRSSHCKRINPADEC